MVRRFQAALVATMLATCGCGDGGGAPIDGPGSDGSPDATVTIDAQRDALPPGARKIFMNRAGGTYAVGGFDSVNNTQGYSNSTVVAPPYPFGDAEWNATRDCVNDLFTPFSVDVVDIDPGAVDHIEIVMTTSPEVFEQPAGRRSITFANLQCIVAERGIAVIFANELGATNTRATCELAAWIAGHMYGLDSRFHCPDVMSSLSGCGDKAFRDVDAPCGDGIARECQCDTTTQPTQNSYRFLEARVGLR